MPIIPYVPSRMTKNGTQVWTNTTWVDLTPNTAVNDATYTSTLTGTLSLNVPANSSDATLTASASWTGSTSNRGHNIRIVRVSDSAIIVTGTAVTGATGTVSVSAGGLTVTTSESYKVQIWGSGTSTGTASTGTNTLTITAAAAGGVTFDAAGAGNNVAGSGGPLTWSHTVGGTGANSVIFVGITGYKSVTASTAYTRTVKFDSTGANTSMTSLGSSDWDDPNIGQWSELFYLLNPPAGTFTMSAQLTTTVPSEFQASSVSYLSVASLGTVVITTQPSVGSTASTGPISTEAGGRVMGLLGGYIGAGENLTSPTGTVRYLDETQVHIPLEFQDLAGTAGGTVTLEVTAFATVVGAIGIDMLPVLTAAAPKIARRHLTVAVHRAGFY